MWSTNIMLALYSAMETFDETQSNSDLAEETDTPFDLPEETQTPSDPAGETQTPPDPAGETQTLPKEVTAGGNKEFKDNNGSGDGVTPGDNEVAISTKVSLIYSKLS